MYSIVLMAALSTGAEVPADHNSCCGAPAPAPAATCCDATPSRKGLFSGRSGGGRLLGRRKGNDCCEPAPATCCSNTVAAAPVSSCCGSTGGTVISQPVMSQPVISAPITAPAPAISTDAPKPMPSDKKVAPPKPNTETVYYSSPMPVVSSEPVMMTSAPMTTSTSTNCCPDTTTSSSRGRFMGRLTSFRR